ncbi:MAG: hypothetical protein EZS28_055837, partial [Streblomastix strix]
EDHSTVSCVTPCPELKTQTTLPSGVMKCVDSCPYGQFRFRRRNGSYICQTHCTGFEKALELDDGSIECIVNNCQDPTPVLQLNQSSSSGYQCVTTAECTLPQTTYTSDDITQVNSLILIGTTRLNVWKVAQGTKYPEDLIMEPLYVLILVQ